MHPVTESDLRACFVNATKGEAKRLAVPKDLADLPWADLDFLGWRDPAATQRAYLVAGSPGGLVGVALRVAPQTGQVRRSMCSLCLTTHGGDGVSLMTALRAGPSGRAGNSVGVYLCSDLACSLYLRGTRDAAGGRLQETISLEQKIERTTTALAAFLTKVTAPTSP